MTHPHDVPKRCRPQRRPLRAAGTGSAGGRGQARPGVQRPCPSDSHCKLPPQLHARPPRRAPGAARQQGAGPTRRARRPVSRHSQAVGGAGRGRRLQESVAGGRGQARRAQRLARRRGVRVDARDQRVQRVEVALRADVADNDQAQLLACAPARARRRPPSGAQRRGGLCPGPCQVRVQCVPTRHLITHHLPSTTH